MKKGIFLFLFIFTVAQLFAQQNSFALKVSGEVITPLELTYEQITQMPSRIVIAKDKKGNNRRYKGVCIQDLLAKAGVTMGKALRGENLAKYVIAACADGYQVLFSLAELDSTFSRDVPIVAYQIDGKPLLETKGPLRIIVPSDKIPARSCFQLKELSVHFGTQM